MPCNDATKAQGGGGANVASAERQRYRARVTRAVENVKGVLIEC